MPNHATHSYLGAILAAIDAEEEAPGPMPDEMWKVVIGGRDATEEAIRIAIRLTKKGIRERIEAITPPAGPSGGNKPVVFCPVSEDGCTEEPVCPWPCHKLKNAAPQEPTSASQSVAGGDHGGSATPADAARKVVELTFQNEALERALRGVIAAEHEFTKDTGIELDDLVAEKVRAAKMILQKFGKSRPPATPRGAPKVQNFEVFWMIWNPNGHAPTYKHGSPQEAKREAERLARMDPGQEFFVLRAESKCKVKEFEWEEAGEYIPF